MPVTLVTKDLDALTMTVVAEFAAPVRRLWDAYADPRQLEKFWGPPTWPATFTRHDMAVGGESHYTMTGPDGDSSSGYWRFLAVTEGESFAVQDGFAKAPGVPNEEMPSMHMVFTFEPVGTGSKVTTVTTFNSLDQLTQLLEMGMEEGLSAAMGQMDAVLADLKSFASDLRTQSQYLGDTQVRFSRIVRGTVEQVWRAHHESDLIRAWMLGPDGWTMPVCEPTSTVGGTYRFEWEAEDGSGRFGFTGELLEVMEPTRETSTERMINTDGPSNRNELTLTSVADGTLVSMLITYPSKEVRDEILATGMVDGMEASFVRLEKVIKS